jgi:hypothetical protein
VCVCVCVCVCRAELGHQIRQFDIVIIVPRDESSTRSGWEKGQVENQVGLVRERFFSPRLRVKSYDELNAWLLDQCVTYARAHRHRELRDHHLADVRGGTSQPCRVCRMLRRVPRRARFGVKDLPGSVRQDSVSARAVGRPVEIRYPSR